MASNAQPPTSDKDGLINLTPGVSEATADIVFVHGLRGDRMNTWTKSGKMWPKDFLSEDIKDARIFTWGYNSDIGGFWTKLPHEGIEAYARNLLLDLSGYREKDGTNDRPIIFVMHSLGGIVVKSTFLLASVHAGKPEGQIEKCTRGMLFLGTPHSGSDLANWGKIGVSLGKLVKLPVNDKNLDTLKENSRELKKLSELFDQLINKRREDQQTKVEVNCFYEELETKYGIIVTEESATLAGCPKGSIPADHKNICRYEYKGHIGYDRVTKVLERWVKALRPQKEETLKPGTHVEGRIYGDNYGGNQAAASVGSTQQSSGHSYNVQSKTSEKPPPS